MSIRLLFIKLVVLALCVYIGSGAYSQWNLLKLWDIPITDANNDQIILDGILYENLKAADISILTSYIETVYPWAILLRYYWQAIGILSVTCGASGGFLREIFFYIKNPSDKIPNWMLLGSLMGPAVILSISGVREILIERGDYKTWPIVALSFLSGCFSEEAFQYLKTVYERISKEVLS
jgi:hypothetical protein